jgi:hypothetical protein
MKQKFFKGDIAIISKNENFDLIKDIEVEIGDTFNQWGMTFKVVDMNLMCIFVKEIE